MLDFHENYRGKSGTSDCPMCHSHEDSQDAISECKFISEKLKGSIHQDIENSYSTSVRKDTIRIIVKVMTFRKELENSDLKVMKP